MQAFFYKYALIAALILGAIGGTYGWHRSIVNAEVKEAEHNIEQEFRISMDEQRKRLKAKADKAEADLKVALGKNNQRKSDEIKAVQSRTGTVAAGVRDAINTGNASGSRPSGSTGENSGTGSSFDLRLSGFDAEVLTKWFAGTASELQTELRACQSDFDAVRDKINKFGEANK